ncbi:DUF2167 domain-containing protein [Luteolibacter luteus]|uniref:DUF2167 domain-containing protein n=1 Tax=Luteolibacter luteus TaxID=2728835 RepID=A0A858RM49_9BACT|nr:DUF2167 domain-containing protein [Luteolibacter luteus]QJE98047.1 DUF2167 domain-containing protein [Luteolibacter luteus]
MRFLSALPLLFAVGLAFAQEAPVPAKDGQLSPEEIQAANEAFVAKALAGITYAEGTAQLPGGIARLELPAGFRFIDSADARKVVVDLWGNPPQQASDLMGMVVPAGESLENPDSWAIVISFSEDGHVSDSDADEIDYNDLLSQLKEGNRQANEALKTQGFPTLELVGWAVPPRYDKQNKALHWAKQLKSPQSEEDTLNYNVRVLGRRGVLVLNGVAGMNRVADVEAATPGIVSMVQFNSGHRYADFNEATDKKSDYSLAGLVLGGAVAAKIATKAGLLAKLGTILIAAKKFVVIGVIALVALVKRLFGRKSAA